MKYSQILERLLIVTLPECIDKGYEKDFMELISEKLYEEYSLNGYIRKTPSEMLHIPTYSYILFLKKLLENKGNTLQLTKGRKEWEKLSYCFINIRATSVTPFHGDFINAAKVLPALRVEGIHVSPFFDHALGILYAIESIDFVSPDFINQFYQSVGISPDDQVKFFIDTCHLLGKVVGFDLEPHTSQFSTIAIEKPEFFRWIKLKRYEDGVVRLDDNLTQEQQLHREYQAKIHDIIREVRRDVLKEFNLKSLRDGDQYLVKSAHLKIIQKLIELGIWSIPNHTWKGIGLPEFSHFVEEGSYPEFRYISKTGENHREHAFGVLTPYKFYDKLPINTFPPKDNKPVLDKNVLKFFSSIFLEIKKRFDFDFIRWDYTDHVFDSIFDEDYNFPISDRLTPYVIKYSVRRIRKKYPEVGMMFERMGKDIGNYYKIEADLILGDDIWHDLTPEYVKDTVLLSKRISKFNKRRKRKISILYAVDTHDTENPVINRNSLKNEGVEGLMIRYFISRFGNAGLGKRPKYECIGTQEGTIGLFEANIKNIPLKWKNNKHINEMYHNLEDLYQKLKDFLENGEIDFVRKRNKIVYWCIKHTDKEILAIINLGKRKTKIPTCKGQKIIDPFKNIEFEFSEDFKIPKLSCYIVI